ncbi:MAG: zf-TFIIB domain-containing protein [Candidatus Melainabacteria bacterium]|nr:zf-TFIIB domain-containing protein [Candidatus Melainabacteria bacterium]
MCPEGTPAPQEEFWKQQEQKLLDQLKEQIRLQEISKLRDLAKLRCPKCGEMLDQEVFYEVPIERCPHCLGIWLDAGELELIAQREHSKESWLAKLWKNMTERRKKMDSGDSEAEIPMS